jgi:hypothetical protein
LLHPPTGKRFVRVSLGGLTGCALAEDGTISCWGANDYGQATPPPGTFIDVSVGGTTTCALDAGHEWTCWGKKPDLSESNVTTGVLHGNFECWVSTESDTTCDQFGPLLGSQHLVPLPHGNYRRIDGDGESLCGITSTGGIECTGPIKLHDPGLAKAHNLRELSMSYYTVCAVTEDGDYLCDGGN